MPILWTDDRTATPHAHYHRPIHRPERPWGFLALVGINLGLLGWLYGRAAGWW